MNHTASPERVQRDRDAAAEAGLVPIAFEITNEGCPGKKSPANGLAYGLCHTCDRFDREGEQVEPALRLVASVCQCVNWQRTDPLGLGGDVVHGVDAL